jgi:hypothetical protein
MADPYFSPGYPLRREEAERIMRECGRITGLDGDGEIFIVGKGITELAAAGRLGELQAWITIFNEEKRPRRPMSGDDDGR